MTGDPIDPTEVESAIPGVYRGPLEAFISRRDALAKQLRASKRREDAERVKALRKPSRMAWTLDQVVLDDPGSVERLAGAILAAQSARDAKARAAQEDVRHAVRAVAEAGARASIRGGHPIESTALVAALRAVMGDADAFADFRAGRLIEIPEGGGLDLLAVATDVATKSERGADEAPAARAEMQRAETSLAKARERAQAADRAVLGAEDRLDAAEKQLQKARTELDRARQDATTAANEVADAERLIADLRERLG